MELDMYYESIGALKTECRSGC